jgi:hypothetical protein
MVALAFNWRIELNVYAGLKIMEHFAKSMLKRPESVKKKEEIIALIVLKLKSFF